MDSKWDNLLFEFRRLGGVAENIHQKEGKLGRGIFSINPCLKSRINTPIELLIRKDDIYLSNNNLRIKDDTEYNNEIKEFFYYYQDNFSWGGGGKESTELFEKGLSIFPSEIKKLIKINTFIDLEERHKGRWDELIKNQFLNSRKVKFRNKVVIAPVWDLVNHEVNALPFIRSETFISTPYYEPTESELTFSYGYKSPIKRAFDYGFFCKETIVFSLPFELKLKGTKVKFICKGLDLEDDKMNFIANESFIIVDGIPIASNKRKSIIRNYFNQLVKVINIDNLSKDIFTEIIRLNYSRRKTIIEVLNPLDNYSAKIISRAIDYEMELISNNQNCI